MRVLLTGGLGNVGQSAMRELTSRGHTVRCLDLKTKTNLKLARRLADDPHIEIAWGDLRRPEDVAAAVHGQDIVVHLAFITPKLSATGQESEKRPEWAREINVGGTHNLITAMQAEPVPPRLIFISSLHVYGRTETLPPPRTVSDPVNPVEHYAQHKVECERMVRESGLQWVILRLAATMPLAMRLDPGMFDVPLENRMEFVHTRDVGLAIANAVDLGAAQGASTPSQLWGRTLLIGGGPRCQYYYREIAERILDGLGIGMLPGAAFSHKPFCTDWLDTQESERLLHYQQRTLEDYVRDMRTLLGRRIRLIRMFRPLVRLWLLSKSPYRQPGPA